MSVNHDTIRVISLQRPQRNPGLWHLSLGESIRQVSVAHHDYRKGVERISPFRMHSSCAVETSDADADCLIRGERRLSKGAARDRARLWSGADTDHSVVGRIMRIVEGRRRQR
jgi:hypothetical protein